MQTTCSASNDHSDFMSFEAVWRTEQNCFRDVISQTHSRCVLWDWLNWPWMDLEIFKHLKRSFFSSKVLEKREKSEREILKWQGAGASYYTYNGCKKKDVQAEHNGQHSTKFGSFALVSGQRSACRVLCERALRIYVTNNVNTVLHERQRQKKRLKC